MNSKDYWGHLVSAPKCKDLGCHHSHPYKKLWKIRKSAILGNPSENGGQRAKPQNRFQEKGVSEKRS